MCTRKLCVLVLLGLLGLAGCDDDSAFLTHALFDLTLADQDLYAIPYPNDIRLQDDGTIDLAGYGKDQPELIQLYLKTVSDNRLGGFGPGAAVFLRFRDEIDATACGPASAEASLQPGASIFLVNIDRSSTHYNTRIPVRWEYTSAAQMYIGDHSLAIAPLPGFVLQPGTIYAAMVTRGMCDPHGDPVQPDPDFELLLDDTPPEEATLKRAHQAYAPLRAYLEQQGLTGVVTAAVFTTGAPTELAGLARAVLYKLAAPVATDLTLTEATDDYYVIEGSYKAPNFQSGTPPYMTPKQGGEIELDSAGMPKVAREESLRFALTVPRRGTMPASGWPVVLYAHGTGGSYRTFIANGIAEALSEVKDDAGSVISRLAVVGIDQVLHGPRAPNAAPELTFFNLQNPAAAVHNVVQGGIDDFSLLRMVKGLSIKSAAWGSDSGFQGEVTFDPPISFDPQRILFMGHSQGGLTGPVFLAYEPQVKAAVLSGTGGGAIRAVLNKTAPVDIPTLIKTVLGEQPHELHPVLNLLQQMLETADTANYGHRLLYDRPQGVAPKHLLLTEGLIDHYTPNVTTESLAVTIGLPQVGPVVISVKGLDLVDNLATTSAALPLAGNLTIGGEAITAGLLQFRERLTGESCTTDADCEGSDYCSLSNKSCAEEGHWVVFDHQPALTQVSRFLATAARDGVPTVFK